MTKKITLLFFICFLSALSINAEVYEGSCGTNVRYSLDTSTGVMKITGTGAMTNYSSYSSAPWKSKQSYVKTVEISNGVTSIGRSAFDECSGLTSVTIPSSVTSIGDWAFRDCSGLTSVTIPNSVTSIEYGAFNGCSGLTSVTIPNSVTSIGRYAFYNCSNVTSVTIADNVTSVGDHAFDGTAWYNNSPDGLFYAGKIAYKYKGTMPANTSITIKEGTLRIGDQAFYNCSGLTSVTIPTSVTSIGGSAFYGCSNLTSVTIGSGVTSIGNSAFYKCSGLTSVTIPNSVTNIGEDAFYGCSGLTSITIPNSVTSIGEGAFWNCSGLTSVTIPNSVTSIGSYAFRICSGLTSVTIPNSVTSIGEGAFWNCSGLTSISVENGNEEYDSRDNCNAIIKTSSNTLIAGCNNTTIPNSVTSIGEDAFQSCSGLTSVTIPNSVTSIGNGAFNYCSSLTSVTIPNSVRSIGSFAFYRCYGLTSVNIPNSVTSIGRSAFDECSGLTSVTIPNSVTSIGERAFGSCYFTEQNFINNSSLDAKTNNYWGATIVDSRNDGFVIKDGTLLKYIGNDVSVTIPNSVTSIGSSAFSGCKSLTSVTIPNSVTSIGEGAFWNCSGLTSVTIPNNVTSIGSDAFYGCSGLTKVTLNSNAIASKSYSSSSTLRSIFGSQVKEYILGDDVTSIGDYAFYNCSGLTSIEIPNSVMSIGGYAFEYCSGLTSATIPNSVTSIEIGAFEFCSGLTSVTIPNSVTSIGDYAFWNCSGLTQVTLNSNAIASKSYSSRSTLGNIFGSQVKEFILGDDVISIGNYAFYNCSNITSVTIADNVTSVGDYAFDGTAWYNNSPDGLFYVGKVAYKYKGTMPENTSVVIKEGTVKLNDNLFSGCSGLISLYIPSSVKTIGNNAFANCTELLDVYCYARKSPTMGTKVFDNSGIQFATLYVPEVSLNGYKVTEPWSGFGSIQALSGDYPEIPEITKCATPTIIFENGKLSFSCETEGVKYVYNFSTPSELDEDGKDINMPNKLQVSVYAKKDGFENSDVATKEIDLGTSGIRGDLNGDGTVNMPDAMFIVNKILYGKFPDE